MAFNGSGTFVRTTPSFSGATCWAQEKAGAFKIVASRHDSHDQAIADGLTNCICKDGQSTPTANISMGGFQVTNLGTGTARVSGMPVGQLQDGGPIWAGTSSGAANVFTAALTPAITAYVTGMRVMFIAHQSNTGACTLGLNGLSATAIRKAAGATALQANDIISGQIVVCVYDGGSSVWRLLSSAHQDWQSWTPTLTPSSGGTTYSATTFTKARYMVKDKICLWQLNFNTTASGTGYLNLNASTPVACVVTGHYSMGRGNGLGTDRVCLVTVASSAISFSGGFENYLTTNYTNTALVLSGSGFYEVA